MPLVVCLTLRHQLKNHSMKNLFTFLLLGSAWMANAQCSYGPTSDATSGAENVSTGGLYEYTGASDFDIPFGTTFTTNKITFNLTKGEADIQFLNVILREEQNGMPGDEIIAFNNIVPTTQEFIYDIPDVDMGCYLVTVDLPTSVVFEKGKYFVQVSAAPGDDVPVGWEITLETQTNGLFDYNKFEDEDWGGTGYYSKVFQIIGTCEDSGEVQPDLGDACHQENPHEAYQLAATFMESGSVVSVADDFTVAPNTTFYLTDFTMNTLILGGGLHNATVNIRSSVDGAPGEILHSFIEKGPLEEKYNGYHTFPGIPFDLVSVLVKFSWANEPIMLTEGNYYIEVIPTPYATDLLAWEATTQPGIGGNSFTSFDEGATWTEHEGINLVMQVDGFCAAALGTETQQLASAVTYFPNPVKDILQLSSDSKIEKVSVYNIEGREVNGFLTSDKKIDMQSLTGGIYLVKVQLETGNAETFKVVKQ